MRSGSVWIHFGVLIAAIVGTNALRSEPGSLFRVLYGWMPLLAGVAAAIRPADRKNVASSVAVAFTAALLMIALDVSSSYQDPESPTSAVLLEGQVQEGGTLQSVVRASWVRTANQWLSGDLDGADQQTQFYVDGHPRLTAVEAFSEFGLILLCFATTGIVLVVGSWMRRHARFDSSANEAGARIAVAWLVSAAVIFLSVGAVADQRFRVLFGEAALWTVLTPSFAFMVLGVAGFAVAARSDRSELADSP